MVATALIGIVADVQYANKADGRSDCAVQQYSASAAKLAAAVDDFNSRKDEVTLVLNLGDSIDGNASEELTRQDLELVSKTFSRLEMPAVHVVGNHCLRVDRETVMMSLGIPSPCYYEKELAPGWILVVLDTTELSMHSGYPKDSEMMLETMEYMKQHAEENLKHWNGGICKAQREWLHAVLQKHSDSHKKCIVACHHPLVAGRPSHHAWAAQELESMLSNSSCVVAVLSGHDHKGGYAFFNGVHHVVIEAMLESATDSTAFAYLEVHQDHLAIVGTGSVTSRTLRC